jgi:hypothetical protein
MDPGPPPDPHFTVAEKAETSPYFQFVVNESIIYCMGATGEGEITSATTVGNLAITFTGCHPAGLRSCSNTGKPDGRIIWSGLSGELDVIKAGETPLKDQIGLTMSGETSFSCEGLVNVAMHGSAIGVIPGHSMSKTHGWRFKVNSKRQQAPEKFEGGIPQAFEGTLNGEHERFVLSMWDTVTTPEKVEINPVV